MSTKLEQIANSLTDNLCEKSNQYNEELNEYIQSINKLSSANVLACILYSINNLNLSSQDIKKNINELLDKDQLMKDYVYDIMKDLK